MRPGRDFAVLIAAARQRENPSSIGSGFSYNGSTSF